MVVIYDSPPALQNPDDIDRALRELYPEESKRRGERGNIGTLLRIGLDGALQEARVFRSSGYPELDDAALAVVRRMQFSPALHQGAPREVWITMWVAFVAI